MDRRLSELRELVMDREAQRAARQGVAKSRTGLSELSISKCELQSKAPLGFFFFFICQKWSKVIQSGLTLYNPMVQAPQSVGYSRQAYWFSSVQSLSRVRLSATPGIAEYWNGLLFSSPEDLPNPGVEPESPAVAYALPSEPSGKFCKNICKTKNIIGLSHVSYTR